MFDLGVVGAGPAGISAALTAADGGLSVVVVDEQARPGGQILRQLPRQRAESVQGAAEYPWGRDLVAAAEAHDSIAWRLGSTALGVVGRTPAGGRGLVLRGRGGVETVVVQRLLIATGAMDLPVPFPGWTLPGVMTAGGVQTLLKSQQTLFAQRSVLTGGHPLLFLVARLLLDRGADVAELVLPPIDASVPDLLRAAAVVPGHLRVMAGAVGALTRMARASVRVTRGSVVTAARGDGRVEEVDIAPVWSDGRIATHRTRTVATEGVVIGYGFQPSTDLGRQVGCALDWDGPAGGWVLHCDDAQRTSVPGVYAAGEPTGVAGADQARLEGLLAGHTILDDALGSTADRARITAHTVRELRSTRRFSAAVQRLFEPRRELLAALATDGTTVCRCESVTAGQLEATIAANPFISSVNALKLECRVGMGPCQGRYCELSVGRTLAAQRGMAVDEVGHFTGQFPVRPVSLGDLQQSRRWSPAL